MKKILSASIVFLSFSILTSNAQKLWTLEECIMYAHKNNITIKRQEIQTEITHNNLKQSYFDVLPDFGAGGNHNIGKGRVADYSSFSYSNTLNAGSVGIRSNVTLFSGFQKINTIKMEQYNFLMAKENLQKAKNDIALTIASAYLQILFDRELFVLSQSQVELAKQQVEKTKKLYEVGNVSKGSLLEMEASYAAELASQTTAKNKLDISYLSLAQILDLDTLKDFEIAIPEVLVPDSFNENPDTIYYLALNHMPQIKSYEYALKSAEKQLAIARGGRLPQLSLSADYYTQYNVDAERPIDPTNPFITEKYPIKDQLNDKLYKQLSINLTIPIFSKYQLETRIKNAKLSKLDAEFALRQSQLQLRKEIQQAYTDALASFENYKSRKQALEAQEENFKYVQQKYDVGMISSIDYNIAKNNLNKAKSDLLQAKYQFIFNIKVLDFYKGNNLSL